MESNCTLICYLVYVCYGLAYICHTGLLRGKQQDPFYQGYLFLVLFRLYVYSVLFLPLYYYLSSGYQLVLAMYIPLYLDLSEFNGSRRYDSIKSSWLVHWAKDFFRCKLVKTVDIDEQCLMAVHHHGMLPFASVVNLGTEATGFSELFPSLKDRVVVAASSCFMVPIFRDLIMAASVVDCNKWSMERWIKNGTTVAVFPGGAHEAEFASPGEVEILDLKRKLGFLRLSMKFNIPVVSIVVWNILYMVQYL